MLESRKIEVLGGLRLLLKWTNLYNKNGVCIKYSKNGDSVKIPDSIAFCSISLPTIYYASLLIWAVIDTRFDFNSISTGLATAIAVLQSTLAYISLAMKTDSIVSIVEHLQRVVVKSE